MAADFVERVCSPLAECGAYLVEQVLVCGVGIEFGGVGEVICFERATCAVVGVFALESRDGVCVEFGGLIAEDEVVDALGDGLTDGLEVDVLDTNPLLVDTDGDGLDDFNDPLPLDPGVTTDWLTDAICELAYDIRSTDLSAFKGWHP